MSLIHSATKLTPFQCTLGYQPLLYPWNATTTDIPSVEDWFKRSKQVWEQTHQHITARTEKHRIQADKKRGKTPAFKQGERIWLSTKDIRNIQGCNKLNNKLIGPYKIIKQINPVTYKLLLPRHLRIHPIFHVFLLKRYVTGPLDDDNNHEQPPEPRIIDNQPVYTINKILKSRIKEKRIEYLIDWEGYSPEEQSWVPARDILDPQLKQAFHKEHPNQPAPRPLGRPQSLALGASLSGGGTVTSPAIPKTATFAKAAQNISTNNTWRREKSLEYWFTYLILITHYYIDCSPKMCRIVPVHTWSYLPIILSFFTVF